MIRLILLAVLLFTAAAPAADGNKPVRRCWFPRFSPDGSALLVANGGWDKKEGGGAWLFDANDGAVRKVIPLARGVRSVAWAAKGTVVVTGCYGAGVHGFDAKTGDERFAFQPTQSVDNVRVTSDDKQLIASFGSGDVRVYDLAAKAESHLFRAVHDGGVWGMALSADDRLLATGGKDGFCQVLDLAGRKKRHAIKHPGEVNGLAFSPDGRRLATGCTDGRVRVFDTDTGERVALFQAHDRGTVTDMQFTSDGKRLATAGADGTVRVWDVADLNNPTQLRQWRGHNGMAFGVAISPDGKRVASAGWDDQVTVWDLASGDKVWAWKRD